MYHGIRMEKSKTLPFSNNAAEIFPWEPSTTGAKKGGLFLSLFHGLSSIFLPPPIHTGYM
jgi:hypothetical protein